MTSLTAHARLRGDRSQQVFDALLRTLAEPGTIRRLPTELLHPDIPVSTWLALALGDVDVEVCIEDDRTGDAAQLVHDATGARLVDLESAWIATFETITPAHIDRIATGSSLQPELGARVCLGVEALDSPTHADLRLVLSGPGIPDERRLGIRGLDPAVAARLGRASGTFPAGFDTWLVTDDGLLTAIARSTQVEIALDVTPTKDD